MAKTGVVFVSTLLLLHYYLLHNGVQGFQIDVSVSPFFHRSLQSSKIRRCCSNSIRKSRTWLTGQIRCAAHSDSAEPAAQEDDYSALISWLESGGGSVTGVHITPNDPGGGGRGLVAADHIRKGQAIITVPQSMQVSFHMHTISPSIIRLSYLQRNQSTHNEHVHRPRAPAHAGACRAAQLAYGGAAGDSDPALLRAVDRVPPGLWAVRLGLKLLREVAAEEQQGDRALPPLPAPALFPVLGNPSQELRPAQQWAHEIVKSLAWQPPPSLA